MLEIFRTALRHALFNKACWLRATARICSSTAPLALTRSNQLSCQIIIIAKPLTIMIIASPAAMQLLERC